MGRQSCQESPSAALECPVLGVLPKWALPARRGYLSPPVDPKPGTRRTATSHQHPATLGHPPARSHGRELRH